MDIETCECGSNCVDDRDDGVFCVECGLELRGPLMEPSFSPPSPMNTASNKQLHPYFKQGRGFPGDRFTGKQIRLDGGKNSFLDDLVKKVSETGEGVRIKREAVSLLREANSKNPLGMRRKSLRGAKGISGGESRDYRLRVFVAAALHVLNDEGQENRAPMIAHEWGIYYSDIAWAIRILNRQRRRVSRKGSPDPVALRREELQFNLNRLREFLSTEVGFREAEEIMISAETRLSEHGEPVGDSDNWLIGRFCNTPSKRVAMIAFAEVMISRGKSKKMVRWLREKVPIIGTKDFIARINLADADSGEE